MLEFWLLFISSTFEHLHSTPGWWVANILYCTVVALPYSNWLFMSGQSIGLQFHIYLYFLILHASKLFVQQGVVAASLALIRLRPSIRLTCTHWRWSTPPTWRLLGKRACGIGEVLLDQHLPVRCPRHCVDSCAWLLALDGAEDSDLVRQCAGAQWGLGSEHFTLYLIHPW